MGLMDGTNHRAPDVFACDNGVESRDIVENFVAPFDPFLARRINALLWAYERGELRHRIRYEPLRSSERRKGGRLAPDPASIHRSPSST